MLPTEKLDALVRRRDFVEAELSSGPDAATFVALSRELAELDPVVTLVRAWQDAQAELAEVTAMLVEAGVAADMAALAEEERRELVGRVGTLETDIRMALLPKDAADEKSAILEVRAGTGGDEASLFAGDLLRMYLRYAELQGWKTEMLSESTGTVGGFKEVAAAIRGRGVFARLRFESGVHRVQRVPATEAGGRIHTSAATVAVLPEAEEVDVAIDEKDLKIDVFRASGAGGQHVNTTEFGRAHHPSADRGGGRRPGRALAAQEQGARDGAAACPSLRCRARADRFGESSRPPRPGRVGRPLGAHPHL